MQQYNGRLITRAVTIYTFGWVFIYAPIETCYTVAIAGPSGLLYGSYIMNIVGMLLMFVGAVAGWRGRPSAPGLLGIGWSWTAATFWRATSDRYWWVAEGHQLFG